ncbi:hypothetical protein E2C01_085186 [Portunus trituberculatus]|uniref:Uncharacterized protein n=1 Tax=Portunus trituberculatus TaxID=210409 RepID=A0A5B7J1Y3_PORTR|nr:hypothetical protein [Portunus trituberculatus]
MTPPLIISPGEVSLEQSAGNCRGKQPTTSDWHDYPPPHAHLLSSRAPGGEAAEGTEGEKIIVDSYKEGVHRIGLGVRGEVWAVQR